MIINEDKLEFDKIKSLLKKNCVSKYGKERYNYIVPFKNLDNLNKQLLIIQDLISFITKFNIKLTPINEIDFIKKEQIYKVKEFNNLRNFIEDINKIKKLFSNQGYINLNKLIKKFNNLDNLKNEIERKINEDNTIRDNATNKLYKIRKDIKKIKETIKTLIYTKINILNKKGYIQDNLYVIRNNRYLLPIKIEYLKIVEGIIHQYSTSGQTAYIEIKETISLNSKLDNLLIKEENEIFKILKELSEKVFKKRKEILYNLDNYAYLDYLYSIAIFSKENDCIKPIFTHKTLKIISGKHPLLGKKAIGVSLKLNYNKNILVISGPNTGGKTITLKMAGVLVLMALYGMFVPANEFLTPYFENILVEIVDNQDISENLSTFSAHIKNLSKIINLANENSLILIDELATGTSPLWANALAMSITKFLKEKQAFAIITTHLNELKTYAYLTDKIEIASMLFDKKSLKPLYKLKIGQIGESLTLQILKILNMPYHIIKDTKYFYNQISSKENQNLIKQLNKKIKEYDEKINLYNEKLKNLDILHKKALNLYNKNLQEKQEIEKNYLIKLNKKLSAKINYINELIKKSDNKKELTKIKKEIINENYKTISKIHEIKFKEKKKDLSNLNFIKNKNFKVSDKVYIKNLNIEGVIREIKKDKALIETNNFSLDIELSKLEKIENNDSGYVIMPKTNIIEKINNEINIRKLHLDEALEKLQQEFELILMSKNFDKIRIIHGKGKGILKEAVWQWLKNQEKVKKFHLAHYNEGGEGATIVYLKNEEDK